MDKTCVICGVIFNAYRSDAEVCSQRCRQKNWRRRKAFGEEGIKALEFEKQIEEFVLNPKNKEFSDALLKKMRQDIFDYGSAIIKTDSDGQQSIINPLSPEGQIVIDMAQKEAAKPQQHPETNYVANTVNGGNEAIIEQIKAIKAEKCPELRAKTHMGRKSWEMDQNKRIKELENQLK